MDLTGKRFGRLTVIDQSGERCFCRCSCGRRIQTTEAYLHSGVTVSCGCSKGRAIDLTGQRFGKLTVMEPVKDRARDNSIRWLCRCDCGMETLVSSNKLRMGHTKSCGCQRLSMTRTGKTFVNGICVEILLTEGLRSNNSSGFRGVSKRGEKWAAYMGYGGRQHWLGTYPSKMEAVAAREKAEDRVRDHVKNLLDETQLMKFRQRIDSCSK